MPKFESFNDRTLASCLPATAGIRVDDATPLHLPSEDHVEKPTEVLGYNKDQEVFKGHGGRMTSVLALPRLKRSPHGKGDDLKLSQVMEVCVDPGVSRLQAMGLRLLTLMRECGQGNTVIAFLWVCVVYICAKSAFNSMNVFACAPSQLSVK